MVPEQKKERKSPYDDQAHVRADPSTIYEVQALGDHAYEKDLASHAEQSLMSLSE